MQVKTKNRFVQRMFELRGAITYLAISRHLYKTECLDFSPRAYLEVKGHNVHVAVFSARALLEAAVVHFGNIYGPGDGGEHITGNKDSAIRTIWNEIEDKATVRLGWSKEDTQRLIGEILFQRNKRLCHFDGKPEGSMHVPNEYVTGIRMFEIKPDKQDRLLEFLEAMLIECEHYSR